MSYYKSDELGLALDAVVESIRRKPSNIEIALIAACVVSVLKIIYKPNIAREHSPNIIGRAVASNVFLQLIFSTTAPAEYFKNALGCSQGDLIEQFDKAQQKASNDIVYDSSTIRAMIIGTRKCLYELVGYRFEVITNNSLYDPKDLAKQLALKIYEQCYKYTANMDLVNNALYLEMACMESEYYLQLVEADIELQKPENPLAGFFGNML